MSRPQAVAIQVSSAQQALLERLRRRQTADQRLVRRASLILALAAEPCVEAVARRLQLARLTVRLWRDRWLEATPALGRAEQHPATPQQLLGLIEQVLGDTPGRAPRPPSAPSRSSRSSPSPVSRRSNRAGRSAIGRTGS
jgi:putative transposase